MLTGSLDVTVGEGVTFRFTVTNAGDDPVTVTFRDSCQADFVVVDLDGEEVWRFSRGRLFTQVMQPARFEPGEEAVFEEAWPEPESGDYTAIAELRVQERDVRAETPFSV
ncbi:BsuPI-related putative proteinase inhibitor [Natronomonas sp. EA1]|uniref:BsuPI-related putative proteinase inhibitor n=1 Tax=Natronomonas sp. EA1 TaxID=3421655 RepID=UPI003EBF201C